MKLTLALAFAMALSACTTAPQTPPQAVTAPAEEYVLEAVGGGTDGADVYVKLIERGFRSKAGCDARKLALEAKQKGLLCETAREAKV